MSETTRTAEANTAACPACGAAVRTEPTTLTGEAPCPACKRALWYVNLKPRPRWFDRDAMAASKRDKLAKAVEAIAGRLGGPQTAAALQDAALAESGLDSLDIAEMVMELEEICGINIPDADAEKLKTIGQVIDYLGEKVKE
jgi:acyl carrier protein